MRTLKGAYIRGSGVLLVFGEIEDWRAIYDWV